MDTQNQLIFDELTFVVTRDEQSLKLNPLSFKLLHVLALAKTEIVSIKLLLESVWPNSTVSPDTLKQRVFVLRKALEQSPLTGLTIQAIRGEGYRLVVEESEKVVATEHINEQVTKRIELLAFGSKRKFVFVSLGLVFIIIAFLIYSIFPLGADKAINNNRIALWSNLTTAEMPEAAKRMYTSWNSMLNQASSNQSLQLVFSSQKHQLSLPIQARKDRVALISYFEVVSVSNETIIKLDIIEPSTATILRSNTVTLASDSSSKGLLESQLNGILSLLSSKKLYLNKKQRDYANDPIWRTLRSLANSS